LAIGDLAGEEAQPQSRERENSSRRLLFMLAALALGGVFFFLFSRFLTPAKLVLDSCPSGATVFINGRLVGATPLLLSRLRPGSYGLRLEKAGYTPLLKEVPFAESKVLIEVLEPYKTGSLLVDIKPAGAEVLLDGEFIGQTPLRRDDIPAGTYELLVRKANFKTRAWPAVKIGEACAEFKNLELEDTILAMLRSSIESEKQCVAHYMDLGYYFFLNKRLDESAQAYCQALEAAGKPLVFPPQTDKAERDAETRIREAEVIKLLDEIQKKKEKKGNDLARFRSTIEKKEEELSSQPQEWLVTQAIAENKKRNNRLEQAQNVYLTFIGISKNDHDLAQAYIGLLGVRVLLHNLPAIRETERKITLLFKNRADVLRQAGHELYCHQDLYSGEERKEMLTQAENIFRTAIGVDMTREGKGQYNFELGIVLFYQGRYEEAVECYKKSLDEVTNLEARENRSERMVECLKKLNRRDEERTILLQLAKSSRKDIAKKAKTELDKLGDE